jgi:hypothetical protein
MGQVERPEWKIIDGEIVEHVYDAPTGMEHYSIFVLTSPLNSLQGQVLYAYARNYGPQAFRLDPDTLPPYMLFFTSLAEARAAAGNVLNEERGIEPFRSKVRYTDEPTLHYCLCCGYRTIKGYETAFGYTTTPYTSCICPICFWQDDPVDYDEPNVSAGGPNHVSMKQAQRNFLAFGASEVRFQPNVRKPTPEDERDPNWRLLD